MICAATIIFVLLQVVPCEVRPVESTGTTKVGNSVFTPGIGWQAPAADNTRSLAIENRESMMRVVDAIRELEAEIDGLKIELNSREELSFPWFAFVGCALAGGAVGTAIVLGILFYVSITL